MRRFLPALLALIISIPVVAQSDDRSLVEATLSETSSVQQKDTSSHRVWHFFRRQLTGACRFYPECVDFFPQAVEELGPVRAVLATSDRAVRCSRVGTASFPAQLKGRDGRIHEDASAYRRRRRNGRK